MDPHRVFGVLLVGSYLLTSAHSLSLEDHHTCALEETYMETKNVSVKHPISVKTYQWCVNVIPRCTIYRTEWRTSIETQVVPMNRTVIGCCPGYMVSDQDTCTPICTSGCDNGTCIAPEICANMQIPIPSLVSPKPLNDPSATRPIESDHDLQIKDTLLTVTESMKTTPVVTPVTTPSSIELKQVYNSSILTTTPQKVTLEDIFLKTSTYPTTPLIKTDDEEADSRPVLTNRDVTTIIDENSEDVGLTNPPNNSKNISVTQEITTESSLKIEINTSRSSQDPIYLSGNSSRRDPLKYFTSTDNKRADNETTYSKPQQMNLSDRFVYSVGISVGIMFAIIMVTLVITKHQHYLQEVDPRCGNTRNSKKCKAAHQIEEQETTLHVVHYQVTRETTNTNQPMTADCELTCVNSTRNSTITVYNFPQPVNAYDAPLRPPVRSFGDYDFPSPMAENVYDEIPGHRDSAEGHRCFMRQ